MMPTVKLKDVPVGDVFEINTHFYMKTNEKYCDSCRCVLIGGRSTDNVLTYAIGQISCILADAEVRILDVTLMVEE